ncbi:hypothetical protein BEL04_13960 [Mucilaginibacter sp. PPCGB 2223]|uniref:hydroxyacid dehydrogenase n=1 Tax=Mucilaginibacter sp. PPCGB 2223 TaxID=1886027 RepID=UPI000824912B|nr:hydroxyacid dehydrogenase [Mucilaginibacter sp. PPCGB 2223]OCX52553.1 hypothetical protein BEL04_13960 [Mucilaginibacter sp. PPCGB 2223]
MPHLPVVFISEPIHAAGMEMLRDKVRIIQAPDTSRDTTIKLIKNADAVILRASTRFDREVIAHADKLKVIARTGVGVNNIDILAATNAGIFVCNAPNANERSVAEHALTMIMSLAKQIFPMHTAVRQNHWEARYLSSGTEINGKTLGLIGFGSIGKITADLCLAVGMKVMAYRPSGNINYPGVSEAQTIAQIFTEADFISLHCPSTPVNYHLVNQTLLGLMKTSAYLINTSRGDLIDEAALAAALNEGKIRGAALDVFEEEPILTSNPVLSARNVILSPHVAGSTYESDERLATIAVRAVLDTLSGKRPSNIINDRL